MMIFLSLRVTADAEGGLKNRAHLRPVLQGVGGGQPPTSNAPVYTGALLATTVAHLLIGTAYGSLLMFFTMKSIKYLLAIGKLFLSRYPIASVRFTGGTVGRKASR